MSTANHRALAVRSRPTSFDDVIGQSHVTVPLRRAVVAGVVPQQVLFSGGSGLGKTTLARIVAAALLCEQPLEGRTVGDPCGQCRSCVAAFEHGNHPDIIELDAASHGRVDEVRALGEQTSYAPLWSDFRVYIVDEAHGLSHAAGQAFLKLLEEPPDHVKFFLATTDPDRMLATNRGRCIEFELTQPTPTELSANLTRIGLKFDLDVPEDVAFEIVDAADPLLGVRGTITSLEKLLPVLSDSPTAEQVAALLGRPSTTAVSELLDLVDAGDTAEVVAVATAVLGRFDAAQLAVRLAAVDRSHLVRAAAAGDFVDAARRATRIHRWLESTTEAGLLAHLVKASIVTAASPVPPDNLETTRPPLRLLETPSSVPPSRPDHPGASDPATATLPTIRLLPPAEDEPAAVRAPAPPVPAKEAPLRPVPPPAPPRKWSEITDRLRLTHPLVASILRACELTVSAETVTVITPNAATAQRLSEHAAAISESAGVPVVIRSR